MFRQTAKTLKSLRNNITGIGMCSEDLSVFCGKTWWKENCLEIDRSEEKYCIGNELEKEWGFFNPVNKPFCSGSDTLSKDGHEDSLEMIVGSASSNIHSFSKILWNVAVNFSSTLWKSLSPFLFYKTGTVCPLAHQDSMRKKLNYHVLKYVSFVLHLWLRSRVSLTNFQTKNFYSFKKLFLLFQNHCQSISIRLLFSIGKSFSTIFKKKSWLCQKQYRFT